MLLLADLQCRGKKQFSPTSSFPYSWAVEVYEIQETDTFPGSSAVVSVFIEVRLVIHLDENASWIQLQASKSDWVVAVFNVCLQDRPRLSQEGALRQYVKCRSRQVFAGSADYMWYHSELYLFLLTFSVVSSSFSCVGINSRGLEQGRL